MKWGQESIELVTLREILERHRGAGQAIKSRGLADLLGLEERDGRSIREAVNLLIEQGCPIGSSTDRREAGYFWVETEEELVACIRNYRSRAAENHRKAMGLIRAFRRNGPQLALL